MKFLKCRECNDLVALRTWLKTCKCVKCGGIFLEDGMTVKVFGPCIVLGFPNQLFFEIEEPDEFVRRTK